MSDDSGKPDNKFQRKSIAFALVASDIWSNPKIVEAGPYAALVFVFSLTRNAVRGRTGQVPRADMTPAYIARQLGIPCEVAEGALHDCHRVRLLDLTGDPEHVVIIGWDEDWKRGPLTEAERVRKADYRSRKRAEAEENEDPRTKKEREKEKQKQNKNVRDKSRTGGDRVFGIAIRESLWPPMSKEEEADAWNIIHTIRWYLSNTNTKNHSSGREREHLVWLMRQQAYAPADRLERFAAYMCDEEGAGWATRTDSADTFPMRSHCTVFGLFTEKNLDKHFSTAIDWEPECSTWKPRIKPKEAA